MYTFVLNDFQSLIMKKTLFFSLEESIKHLHATLKESPVRIFLHKEENEKKSKFYCCHCSNRLVISFFPVMLPCLIYVCKEAFSISRIGKLEHIRNIFVQ